MSLKHLSTRQANIASSIKHINQLSQQLASLQPRSSSEDDASTPTSENKESRSDLTAEIHAGIKQLDEELDFLKQDIEDLEEISANRTSSRSVTSNTTNDRALELRRLGTTCVSLGEDLKLCRARFRKAQLQASANAERASQRERTTYLTSLQAAAAATASPPPTDTSPDSPDQPQAQPPKYTSLFAGRRPQKPKDTSNPMNDDILITATTDVTQSLKRTHALLSSELSRSQFAHDTLESSNAALEELNTRYSSFDDLISKSRGLLGTLLSSQKSDTWYLETAIWVLVATIAWLLFRRLLYGPLWWFAYLPLKLAWSVLVGLYGVVAGKGGSEVGTGGVGGTAQTWVSGMANGTVVPLSSTITNSPTHAAATPAHSVVRSRLGSLSDRIGSAVEEAWVSATNGVVAKSDAAGNEAQRNEQSEHGKPPRRGDGQTLRERDEQNEPRNPKKRMMEEEEGAEEGQEKGKKDEL